MGTIFGWTHPLSGYEILMQNFHVEFATESSPESFHDDGNTYSDSWPLTLKHNDTFWARVKIDYSSPVEFWMSFAMRVESLSGEKFWSFNVEKLPALQSGVYVRAYRDTIPDFQFNAANYDQNQIIGAWYYIFFIPDWSYGIPEPPDSSYNLVDTDWEMMKNYKAGVYKVVKEPRVEDISIVSYQISRIP